MTKLRSSVMLVIRAAPSVPSEAGPAVVRECGEEQGGETLAPIVDLVAQAERVAHRFLFERPERFADVAGRPWPAGFRRRAGFQHLELKAGVELREVVQECNDGEAGFERRAQAQKSVSDVVRTFNVHVATIYRCLHDEAAL